MGGAYSITTYVLNRTLPDDEPVSKPAYYMAEVPYYFGVNVKIKNNKKVLTPPNNWVNLSKPLYNNESNIGILCGEVNDFFVIVVLKIAITTSKSFK